MLPQELRKVAYRGNFSDLVYQLSEQAFLKLQLKIENDKSPAYAQMADAEYVLRFFALSESWQHFSGSLRDELDACMVRHMKDAQPELDVLRNRFTRALDACQEIWGIHAFQRFTGTGWRDQFLAGVYDAEMLAANELSDSELKSAKINKAKILEKTHQLFLDRSFERTVRQGTNTPSFVRERISRIIDILRTS